MIVLGLSPLDKDASASLVVDGEVVFAAGEERFSRRKQHAGFPTAAVQAALHHAGLSPADVDVVAYPFLDAAAESERMAACLADDDAFTRAFDRGDLEARLRAADARVPVRDAAIHGLASPNQRMVKGLAKRAAYRLAGASRWSGAATRRQARAWLERAQADHRHWQDELETHLRELGLADRLKRFEHHVAHAAGAYHLSGFERALIVTLDGYGTGLAGSVSLGEGGTVKRLAAFPFPHSLGTFYETVTASLGFSPDRHAGKIVGLAAYGDPDVLTDVLLSRCERGEGTYRLFENLNVHFSRHLASRYPMVDVAAAYQKALEVVAADVVRHWVGVTGCDALVLSGGVTANVKMNQRLHEVDGVERIFVDPNMGDGGCGTGLGLHLTRHGDVRAPLRDVYLGPSFTSAEIRAELEREGLSFSEPADLAGEVAARIHGGQVVARFDGRMEYGPRALGNRSILYHGREPSVNQWLNERLGRTEFMPFAPVVLAERAHDCFENLRGAEHAAEFMTVTFDCTPWMIENCPAAVHVDGTARPQLVHRERNPGYHAILEAYERLSGVPCLINTSFNMHEEPIVCTPRDAVRAFLDGRLDALVIGGYLVDAPGRG